jgi:starch phosphorylase
VAAVINHDPSTRDFLKLVFLPDYGVSRAELIMPAADLSEQISTAGTEASGTGNMKLALNGALTIGTEDGANIEIRDQVGAESIFIFGHDARQVAELDHGGYQPLRIYESNARLRAVLDAIAGGRFSPEEPDRYRGIVDALLWGGDRYKLLADYDAYVAAQERVDALYRRRDAWLQHAIANVAGMGPFSSDRSVRTYATEIWNVPVRP